VEGAAASAALLALTWLASFHVHFIEHADQRIFVAFYDVAYQYNWPHVIRTLHIFVSLCNPSHYVYLAAFSIVVALLRKAWPAACAASFVLIGANLTTLVLKAVLPEPPTAPLAGVLLPVPYPRWPSGHSTAAMAVVVALVLAAPPRLRSLTAGAGAVFAAIVGYAVLAFGTHLPSDVVGGFLVASLWGLGAVVGLSFTQRAGAVREAPRKSPVSLPGALVPPVVALLLLAAAAATVVLLNPHAATSYARDHSLILVGGLAIAALSTAISTAVALGMRGPMS
jgi:membrane-associated phospholipid phosphatase